MLAEAASTKDAKQSQQKKENVLFSSYYHITVVYDSSLGVQVRVCRAPEAAGTKEAKYSAVYDSSLGVQVRLCRAPEIGEHKGGKITSKHKNGWLMFAADRPARRRPYHSHRLLSGWAPYICLSIYFNRISNR
jgi:hypothetical protein